MKDYATCEISRNFPSSPSHHTASRWNYSVYVRMFWRVQITCVLLIDDVRNTFFSANEKSCAGRGGFCIIREKCLFVSSSYLLSSVSCDVSIISITSVCVCVCVCVKGDALKILLNYPSYHVQSNHRARVCARVCVCLDKGPTDDCQGTWTTREYFPRTPKTTHQPPSPL